MAIKRALTIQNILDKKYDLFDFEDEWFDAFDKPEKTGVWFIWGNSGNGKTSFTLKLMEHLSRFEHIVFNSREEGTKHTLKKSLVKFNMQDDKNKIHVVDENMEVFTKRLNLKKSAKIAVIDSYQTTQMTFNDYLKFKEQFPKKLIIFISQASGRKPTGRPAESVMYDASLKICVEGYKAFSKGRYIGTKGNYTIWPEKAFDYWGEHKKVLSQI